MASSSSSTILRPRIQTCPLHLVGENLLMAFNGNFQYKVLQEAINLDKSYMQTMLTLFSIWLPLESWGHPIIN